MKDSAQVRRTAVGYLTRREYCPREMVDKLVSKGAVRAMAEAVVEELNAQDLISERRFAVEFIRARIRRGYGPVRIKYELMQRGVTEAMTQACLNDSNTNWIQQLAHVIEKKYATSAIDSFNEWSRRANFLKNRGFTTTQIKDVLGDHRGGRPLN